LPPNSGEGVKKEERDITNSNVKRDIIRIGLK
jgi:hypothetical protein